MGEELGCRSPIYDPDQPEQTFTFGEDICYPVRMYDPASGALVGTSPIPGGAASGPVLAQGLLFVVSGQGQLLAFR